MSQDNWGKWVYKTKLKENGEVDKYKACLVPKGYKHEFSVDYKEVFAPVARHDTIILVVSLAAKNSWPIFQLDVKSTFLHGELQEKVFVDQPPGYVKVKDEHKVYRLKKALYGLKQAPRACAMIEKFKRSMMVEFEMSDLRKMHYFLEIEVVQSASGIFISQKKIYAQEMSDKFQMANCNPMEVGLKLVRDPEGRKIDNTLYKQIAGSLICQEDFSIPARNFKMWTMGEISSLVGFTDSDYAGDLGDRKSTSRYVFMMSSAKISWCSKNQPIFTLSTTEAEFVAATVCTCQAIWLKKILEELYFKQEGATKVYCDNSSAIKLSKNPVLHKRSKHIDVKFHFLRDLTRDGVIELYYCKSEDQIADIMTKPLKLPAFQKLRELLEVCAINKSLN
ncbi:retrovirus-related Pol polyprotein from transposon TNT 1-94 [Cucumis melo var. makuwa]|uniref:Retrovirus-related Pol polyprotein from transposon TNT 1-94 n=1 Tax=Cucumis melo var. makuwa TaxID=1194695 RepID=A0A5A7UQ30_CUCMM|nr:retrovirus-related Pol polyprotein from transposon TNT 1-94 [Cucumis melo var. makuwa]TYK18744.1 retrovirus-related Pol polyprotein from transposon TNT 1-94 [Cucumis melo var. makuwa]